MVMMMIRRRLIAIRWEPGESSFRISDIGLRKVDFVPTTLAAALALPSTLTGYLSQSQRFLEATRSTYSSLSHLKTLVSTIFPTSVGSLSNLIYSASLSRSKFSY